MEPDTAKTSAKAATKINILFMDWYLSAHVGWIYDLGCYKGQTKFSNNRSNLSCSTVASAPVIVIR